MFSFTRRKKLVDASPYMRRIIDLTSPNRPVANDERSEARYNRTIPVVMCPSDASDDLSRLVMGVTTDLSDSGLGVLYHDAPIEGETLMFSFVIPTDDIDVRCFIANIETHESKFGFMRLGLSMAQELKTHDPRVQKFQYVVTELVAATYPEKSHA